MRPTTWDEGISYSEAMSAIVYDGVEKFNANREADKLNVLKDIRINVTPYPEQRGDSVTIIVEPNTALASASQEMANEFIAKTRDEWRAAIDKTDVKGVSVEMSESAVEGNAGGKDRHLTIEITGRPAKAKFYDIIEEIARASAAKGNYPDMDLQVALRRPGTERKDLLEDYTFPQTDNNRAVIEDLRRQLAHVFPEPDSYAFDLLRRSESGRSEAEVFKALWEAFDKAADVTAKDAAAIDRNNQLADEARVEKVVRYTLDKAKGKLGLKRMEQVAADSSREDRGGGFENREIRKKYEEETKGPREPRLT